MLVGIMRLYCFLTATLFLITTATTYGQGERVFKEWDKNEDGFLIKEEVPANLRRFFDQKDANGDGKVSLDEHLGRAEKGKGGRPEGGEATFTIRQTWEQEPDGYDRPIYVSEPKDSSERAPVVIYFHGNGGNAAGAIGKWARTFPNHLVVAPQGYERSWNVQGEKSKAPDVSFFKRLIAEIKQRYKNADMNSVSLIGSSNGAAYIYRLLIEVDEDLFQAAVPQVSSLLKSQYHDDSFWKSSNESNTEVLDIKAEPAKVGRRILYLHGTEDNVVPFDGGMRSRRYEHLSAYDTANILARHFGYRGENQAPNDGKEITEGLIQHIYDGTEFTFVAVEGGNHGLAPHQQAAVELVRKFIEKN